MTFLLAIDPAAERPVSNTGWALGEFSEEEPFALIESGVVEGGFLGFTQSKNLHKFIRAAEVLVCEKYITYNKAGDPTPMLIEGAVRYLRPGVVLQPSSILGKNGLVPDSLVKAYGVYRAAGHHKDELSAIKHALHFVIASRHKPTLLKVRGLSY